MECQPRVLNAAQVTKFDVLILRFLPKISGLISKPRADREINGVTWGPYKWPENIWVTGVTLISGVRTLLLVGAHLVHSLGGRAFFEHPNVEYDDKNTLQGSQVTPRCKNLCRF